MTMALGALNEGDCLRMILSVRSARRASQGLKKVAVVGGGLGCAIAYPQAKKLHEMGAEVPNHDRRFPQQRHHPRGRDEERLH